MSDAGKQDSPDGFAKPRTRMMIAAAFVLFLSDTFTAIANIKFGSGVELNQAYLALATTPNMMTIQAYILNQTFTIAAFAVAGVVVALKRYYFVSFMAMAAVAVPRVLGTSTNIAGLTYAFTGLPFNEVALGAYFSIGLVFTVIVFRDAPMNAIAQPKLTPDR